MELVDDLINQTSVSLLEHKKINAFRKDLYLD